MALRGNASAFNGYHWTRSDWSAVVCLRPHCTGTWRTKSSYVDRLPDCTGRPQKVERLRAEVARRGEFVQGLVVKCSKALGKDFPRVGAAFSGGFSSSRQALLGALRSEKPVDSLVPVDPEGGAP